MTVDKAVEPSLGGHCSSARCPAGAAKACRHHKTNYSGWNLSNTWRPRLHYWSLVLGMANAVASCGHRWPRNQLRVRGIHKGRVKQQFVEAGLVWSSAWSECSGQVPSGKIWAMPPGVRMEVLPHLHAMFLFPPADLAFPLPLQVDCLVLQLHRVGEQLEKMNGQRMDELFILIRDGFLLPIDLSSLARLLLLEIIEFRAAGWKTTPAAHKYYYSEVSD